MSVLYYTSRYKGNVMSLLINDDMFVKLINPGEPVNPSLTIEDQLKGGTWNIGGTEYKEQGYVFDYVFANDTTTDEKTFVFIDAFNGHISNGVFVDFDVYIYVCCSRKLIMLDSTTTPTVSELRNAGYYAEARANRVDTLCDCIHGIINKNYDIKGIGRITPNPSGFVMPYNPNNNYYGKCLRYQIPNYNGDDDEC